MLVRIAITTDVANHGRLMFPFSFSSATLPSFDPSSYNTLLSIPSAYECKMYLELSKRRTKTKTQDMIEKVRQFGGSEFRSKVLSHSDIRRSILEWRIHLELGGGETFRQATDGLGEFGSWILPLIRKWLQNSRARVSKYPQIWSLPCSRITGSSRLALSIWRGCCCHAKDGENHWALESQFICTIAGL